MFFLGYTWISYFFSIVLYSYWNYKNQRERLLERPNLKVRYYLHGMISQWIPALILLALFYSGFLTIDDIGLNFYYSFETVILLLFLIILILNFIISILQVSRNKEAKQKIYESRDLAHWFLPKTKKELLLFVFGLSITAGICEELIFRGYLINFLNQYMDIYASALISSILFGLGHTYQGAKGVIKTFFVGLLFASLFILTNSLLIPILLHIAIDAYSGILAYTVSQNTDKIKTP